MTIHFSSDIRRFNHLISETDAAYHEMSLKLGLSDSAMQILYTLCGNEDGSCLLRLEMAGGKRNKVILTEKGLLLAGRTAGRVIEAENRIFASWPREDVETYLELTRRYLEDLRRESRNFQSVQES